MEQEKAQKAADIRIRGGEVQVLQKDLDLINGTAMKLETQKAEAQKKLDELDDRVSDVIFALHFTYFYCVYAS